MNRSHRIFQWGIFVCFLSTVQARELKVSWSKPIYHTGAWTVDHLGVLHIYEREHNPKVLDSTSTNAIRGIGRYNFYHARYTPLGDLVARAEIKRPSDSAGSMKAFPDGTLYSINPYYLQVRSSWVLTYDVSPFQFRWSSLDLPQPSVFGVDTDSSGNVFGLTRDGFTKWDSDTGAISWLVSNASDGSPQDSHAVVLDPSLIWLITMEPSENQLDQDLTITAYDGDGNQLSRTTWGAANVHEAITGAVTDGSGNVYISGFTDNGLVKNILTAKFDSSGNELWTRTYEATKPSEGTGVALSPTGDVLVSGSFTSEINPGFLIQYDSDGTLINVPYTAKTNVRFTRVETSPDGGIYIATNRVEFDGRKLDRVLKLTKATSSISGTVTDGSPEFQSYMVAVARDPDFRDIVDTKILPQVGPYTIKDLPAGKFYVGVSSSYREISFSSYLAHVNQGGVWGSRVDSPTPIVVEVGETIPSIDLPATQGGNPLTAPLPLRDLDQDHYSDDIIFNPQSGLWTVAKYKIGDRTPFLSVSFGAFGDRPVPGDYDGDGIMDFAVFRPSTNEWFYYSTLEGRVISFVYGAPGDIPIPADYDGDRITDPAVIRPSSMTWYIYGTFRGPIDPFVFGAPGMTPVPADYDGDGLADPGMYSSGNWFVFGTQMGPIHVQYGADRDIPIPGDMNADGLADFCVYRDWNHSTSRNFYFPENGHTQSFWNPNRPEGILVR